MQSILFSGSFYPKLSTKFGIRHFLASTSPNFMQKIREKLMRQFWVKPLSKPLTNGWTKELTQVKF